MTNYQKAVESACSKCPMSEPGCRDKCPTFKRELNKAIKESRPLKHADMTPEESAKFELSKQIVREARKVNAKVNGRKIPIVLEKEKGAKRAGKRN